MKIRCAWCGNYIESGEQFKFRKNTSGRYDHYHFTPVADCLAEEEAAVQRMREMEAEDGDV